MSDRKLVVIGGSSPNTPALFKALDPTHKRDWDEVCLVGRSAERLEQIGQTCAALVAERGLELRVSWDTDLAQAAQGAWCVLNMLRVGGAAAVAEDRRLLAASGVVGHAASYPEAIRHVEPTLAAARTVESVAPDAIFVNFANPVSILCEAVASETRLTCLGICHHAFSMRTDFARLLSVAQERVRVEYLGLNHLGWVTDVLVDGESRLGHLVDVLVARQVKAYDYQLAAQFNAIPIKHAAALYRAGEVFYVRQAGLKNSAVDVLLRYGVGGAPFRRVVEGREQRADLAPHDSWYSTCIIPFLDALDAGGVHEFVLTWRSGGLVPGLPGRTAESTSVVHGRQVTLGQFGSRLPQAAVEWLHLVRQSERLLLSAVAERSPFTLFEALAIHPSVASVEHARRFVEGLAPFRDV